MSTVLALIAFSLSGCTTQIQCDRNMGQILPQNEVVMRNGMVIDAETPNGKITITAGEGSIRSYTLDGVTRSARLWARGERWNGSFGLYYPAPFAIWKERDGVITGMLEEGCLHFNSVQDALSWIQDPSNSRDKYVYTGDGLAVGWFKHSEAKILYVSVWQFYVNGERPKNLLGADDSLVRVSFTNADNMVNTAMEQKFLGLTSILWANGPIEPSNYEPLSTKEIRRNYNHSMKELRRAESEIDRFYALGKAARSSLEIGEVEDARRFANELDQLKNQYQDDWNYGNAIQDVNIVLGRIALQEGRVNEATKRLIATAKGPGSPQLDTFGPNMSFAKDLLEKGETNAVLEFLHLCKSFWAEDDGKLNQWIDEIQKGDIPEFGPNLFY